MMVSVGIDVSKDKHDCFIVNSEGEILADVFTIPNNMDGFHYLLQRIQDCANTQNKIKVGLEATGHYSYNLLGFLLDNGLPTYVLNPLRTNIYRKSLSLRKTKTDRVDARTIASMLLSDVGLKPYTDTAYHNEELKSLTRYRFDKVKERAKLRKVLSLDWSASCFQSWKSSFLLCILLLSTPCWRSSPVPNRLPQLI